MMKSPRSNFKYSIREANNRLLGGKPVYADTDDGRRFRVLRIWSGGGAHLIETIDGSSISIDRIKDLN
jgi:hypothetical protein